MSNGTELYTTLALARRNNACYSGIRWASIWVKCQGGTDKTPIPLVAILDHAPEFDALSWAIWSLRAVPDEQAVMRVRVARAFACDCAEHVLPVFETRHPGDNRPRVAIETARRYTDGEATAEELSEARFAADFAAGFAACAAAYSAACAAAFAAAAAATYSYVSAAADAACDAVAARRSEREWQTQRLRGIIADAAS